MAVNRTLLSFIVNIRRIVINLYCASKNSYLRLKCYIIHVLLTNASQLHLQNANLSVQWVYNHQYQCSVSMHVLFLEDLMN